MLLPVPTKQYVSTERLFINARGRVVKADDPTARTLLVGEGGYISAEDAQRYGLLDQPGPAVDVEEAQPTKPLTTKRK